MVSNYDLQFQAIDKLEALGINKLDIKKCKDSGYHTADALLMNTAKVLLAHVLLYVVAIDSSWSKIDMRAHYFYNLMSIIEF